MKWNVIFDLDDTLYEEKCYVKSGFKAVSEWLKERGFDNGFEEISWRIFEEGQRGLIFNHSLEELKIKYNNDFIKELVHIYRNHIPLISLYSDAEWALQYYYNKYKLSIITDGYLESQKRKIESLQIERFFTTIVYSDEFGRECWKPSEVPYKIIMNQSELEGSSFVYIGDNPNKDFVTARKLGWNTIQIIRPESEYSRVVPEAAYKADYEINSLKDLINIL